MKRESFAFRRERFNEWYTCSEQWDDISRGFLVDPAGIAFRLRGVELVLTRGADSLRTLLRQFASEKSESPKRLTRALNTSISIDHIDLRSPGRLTLTGRSDREAYHQEMQHGVDAHENLLQHAIAGKPFQIEGRWVLLTPSTRVQTEAMTWSVSEYVEILCFQTKVTVYPEVDGQLDLGWCGKIIRFEGQRLALFKQTLRANQNFPLIVGSSWLRTSANDLQAALGTDAAHPRQVIQATFTLFYHRNDAVVGLLAFPNQGPVVEGGQPLGLTEDRSEWTIQKLANWMAGESSKLFIGSIHYHIPPNCQVTIRSSDGKVQVGPFVWEDRHARSIAAIAIRSHQQASRL
jgi:hypothetical protein